MSEPAPLPLLARDTEQLDRAAMQLRDGRRGFSILVCPHELWPAATRHLAEKSGKEVPEPHLVLSGDEAVRLLIGVAEKPPSEVASLAIDGTNIEVLSAVNWHREKLRRGAHVLVWVGSAEDLGAFVEHAPDAYSFRDYTLVVHGEEEPSRGWEGEEPVDIKTARLLFELPRQAEEQAEAAAELAKALRLRGRHDEAADVAARGLTLIPATEYTEYRHTDARIRLYESLAHGLATAGRVSEAFRAYRHGMLECGTRADAARKRLYFELRAAERSPLGPGREMVTRALQEMDSYVQLGLAGPLRAQAAIDACRRGRFSAALQHWNFNLAIPGVLPMNRVSALLQRARLHRRTGRLENAEDDRKAAENTALRAGIPRTVEISLRVDLLIDRAELSAAERFAASIPDRALLDPSATNALMWNKTGGDMGSVMSAIAQRIQERLAVKIDLEVFEECCALVTLLEEIRHDFSISSGCLSRALEIVETAGGTLIKIAGDDPPWYRVLVPGLRARLLSLLDSRHDEAARAAAEALSLSLSLWKQALPLTTRTLVQCLARAGRWSGMEPAVRMALDAAREADHLIELATVRAYDLARFVHTGATRDTLEQALSALRSTFAEMDAPRVEADTWLQIAPFLPPTTAFPDPMEIADRAHGLYLDMPMPEPAARCMEWLGDIHAARGERARAEGCYRMSLGTVDRYDLSYHRPRLTQKLAAVTSSG
jgi:tetratricopeptide (TPR) repeat protein